METESVDVLEHFQLNSCSRVGMKLAPRSYVKGHLSNCCLSFEERNAIKSAIGIDTQNALTFSQVYHEGTLIRSTSYGKTDGKQNSSVCSFQNSSAEEEYGVVDRFCIVSSQTIALIRPYKVARICKQLAFLDAHF